MPDEAVSGGDIGVVAGRKWTLVIGGGVVVAERGRGMAFLQGPHSFVHPGSVPTDPRTGLGHQQFPWPPPILLL